MHRNYTMVITKKTEPPLCFVSNPFILVSITTRLRLNYHNKGVRQFFLKGTMFGVQLKVDGEPGEFRKLPEAWGRKYG